MEANELDFRSPQVRGPRCKVYTVVRVQALKKVKPPPRRFCVAPKRQNCMLTVSISDSDAVIDGQGALFDIIEGTLINARNSTISSNHGTAARVTVASTNVAQATTVCAIGVLALGNAAL